MRRTFHATAFALLLAASTTTARADGLLFSYDCDVLPGDPASGFAIFNSCAIDCSRRLENGHFVLEWGMMGDVVNYSRFITQPPDVPPDTLWIEWQFRSNQAIPTGSTTCDGNLTFGYKNILDIAWMFQNAVVDNEGGDFVLGLDPNMFHTYRFESLDGVNYTMSVDGRIFNVESDFGGNDFHFVQFGGSADCASGPERPVPVRNEWDYVRYGTIGTIGTGELVAAVDPPPGNIVTPQGEPLDVITITFDQPAYLYVDDITVSVTGGVAPTVVATRRPDNGVPEVLEVVIQGGLPLGQTTTFTFDTGAGPQSVQYTRIPPGIPVASTWDLLVFALGTLIAGGLIFRGRVFV